MQEFNLAQFIVLTVLQCFAIVLYFFFMNRIKNYSKRLTSKDISFTNKLNRTKKMMFYTHLFLIVIMIIKTNYENEVEFRNICKLLWFVDVVIMAFFSISFFWRIYKFGWG